MRYDWKESEIEKVKSSSCLFNCTYEWKQDVYLLYNISGIWHKIWISSHVFSQINVFEIFPKIVQFSLFTWKELKTSCLSLKLSWFNVAASFWIEIIWLKEVVLTSSLNQKSVRDKSYFITERLKSNADFLWW